MPDQNIDIFPERQQEENPFITRDKAMKPSREQICEPVEQIE